MAIIKPFKPLRPVSRFAGAVVAPPYDSVSLKETRQILRNNPLSFLKVLKPEANVPFYSTSKSAMFREAKHSLDEFMEGKIFVQEKTPHFYIYTESIGEHVQSGIVGLFSCNDYEKGIIKGTEKTKYKELDDRIRWVECMGIQAGPSFLMYRENKSIREIVNRIKKESPEYDFITEDGVRHTVHSVLKKAVIVEIQSLFLNIPVLYVADGNHRVLATCRVFKKYGIQSGFFLGAAVPHNNVCIMEYNRIIKDLNGLSKDEFLYKLNQYFYVQKIGKTAFKPDRKHFFGMFLKGNWYKLMIKNEYVVNLNPPESLDVSLLSKYVFRSIFGIMDERDNGRIDFISGKEGAEALEEKVQKNGWAVSFSLFPITVSEITAVADNGFIMSPKSTWFEPKFRSGLFLDSLDEIKERIKKDTETSQEDYTIWL
ncbi:MAG: DUF1015 domain-containing protein [Caldisericaceae bacterium]|nr:DUF1015 domain-containing protein [Caldisericaceae bacterium]